MELIKIGQDQMIDARELHGFLEVGTLFHIWIKRRIEEYGLVQPIDFIEIRNDHNEIKELRLSLDTAKELCMVEKNERGKQARRYFIEIEKKWKTSIESKTPTQLLAQIAQQMVIAEQKQLEQAKRLDTVEDKLLLLASDSDYRTVRGLSRVMGISISEKAAADIGKRATAICKNMGLHVGKVADERHGSVNSYPIRILEPLLESFKLGKI